METPPGWDYPANFQHCLGCHHYTSNFGHPLTSSVLSSCGPSGSRLVTADHELGSSSWSISDMRIQFCPSCVGEEMLMSPNSKALHLLQNMVNGQSHVSNFIWSITYLQIVVTSRCGSVSNNNKPQGQQHLVLLGQLSVVSLHSTTYSHNMRKPPLVVDMLLFSWERLIMMEPWQNIWHVWCCVWWDRY